MIQVQSKVYASDNSGANVVKCIKVLGGFNKTIALVGEMILVSIRSIRFVRKVKTGQIYPAILIRSKKSSKNFDGSFSRFGTNSVVLLNQKKKILGNRVLGPISKKLRKKKYLRLILMSGEIII